MKYPALLIVAVAATACGDIDTNENIDTSDGAVSGRASHVTDLLAGTPAFMRGDANGDGVLDISDASAIADQLFGKAKVASCREALDVNGDGKLEGVTEIIALTNFLYQGGPPPAAPYEEKGKVLDDGGLECVFATAADYYADRAEAYEMILAKTEGADVLSHLGIGQKEGTQLFYYPGDDDIYVVVDDDYTAVEVRAFEHHAVTDRWGLFAMEFEDGEASAGIAYTDDVGEHSLAPLWRFPNVGIAGAREFANVIARGLLGQSMEEALLEESITPAMAAGADEPEGLALPCTIVQKLGAAGVPGNRIDDQELCKLQTMHLRLQDLLFSQTLSAQLGEFLENNGGFSDFIGSLMSNLAGRVGFGVASVGALEAGASAGLAVGAGAIAGGAAGVLTATKYREWQAEAFGRAGSLSEAQKCAIRHDVAQRFYDDMGRAGEHAQDAVACDYWGELLQATNELFFLIDNPGKCDNPISGQTKCG